MSTAGDRSHHRKHILVFPFPAQGHLLPLLSLAHNLSLRFSFTVTVVTTPKNLPILSRYISPTFQPLTLPFPVHPAILPGIENLKDIGPTGATPFTSALTQLSPLISSWFRSHPDPPVALIFDFFLGWSATLARDLNIPCLAFFSSGALVASVNDRCWPDIDAVKKMDVVDCPNLPGSPAFREEHLPGTIHFYDGSNPDWAVVKESMLANLSSFGCILNTLEPLEKKYLNHLKQRVGHERIYAVGPISQLGPNQFEADHLDSSVVLSWLDTCPKDSVLYVCFGSEVFLTVAHVKGLARGLEKSRVRFVWVFGNHGSPVPVDFEDQFSGRGIIMKGWAPQVKILEHKAVGGFLSHCGWNSILEGLAAGVAFLAWPMGADQYLNSRLLTKELQVGAVACEGRESVPDETHLAQVIGDWAGADGEAWRARALELKDKTLKAVGEGGTSQSDLKRLGMDLLSFPGVRTELEGVSI